MITDIVNRRFDRRGFLGACAGAVAAAASLRPSSVRGGSTNEALARSGGPYIDVHTHIGRVWNADPPLTDDALIQWMDEHNIIKAVLLPLVSPESSSYLNTNECALEAARRRPDRFIPFCCVDPRTSYGGGAKGLRLMIQEYVDQGAKGFGEHKAGLPIDDPKMKALYAACADLKLPVLFHCDNERGTDKPGLPGLERVLKEFPTLPFIGHGPGFWASISANVTQNDLGGYPKGRIEPGGTLDRLFDHYPNLWGDLSAGSGANALARDAEFARGFLVRRAERLLFGTDYLKPRQEVPQFEVLARIELPDDIRAKIERGNAAKLLGVKIAS
jgi:predicted TIM-barrel fold metal-dependent hydrolase